MNEVMQVRMEEFEKAEHSAYLDGAIGLDELVGVTTSFIVIAIIAGFGALMLNEMKDNINETANPDAGTVLDNGVSGIKTVTSYLELIGLAIVIGIILTVVMVYLYRRFQ